MSLKEEILARLNEIDASPKKSLGQNFLIGEHVVDKMIEEVIRLKPTHVIEIGPGLGTLTGELRVRNIPKTLIELDTKVAAYWRKHGEHVIEHDALQLDWSTNFAVTDPQTEMGPTILLSNLPYQISSRLVIDLSTTAPWLSRMILMFQKEVAERLVANARTDDYGFLSVVAQTHWQMSKVTDASQEDFYPKPNVLSRVMSFKRRPENTAYGAGFTEFVKKAFSQRRKMMLKAFQDKSDPSARDRLVAGLEMIGHTDKVRAEELSPQDFQKLYSQK